jgi:ABC-type Fe3+-hydroxamate transport system substrate-binding protein
MLGREATNVSGWRVMSLDGGLNTYGKGSLLDAEIAATGASNLAAARGVGPYRKLDLEAVLSWRPDALLVGVLPGEEAAERQRMLQQPGLQLLPCVQQGRVLFVPSALLVSTSQYAVEAVACIQQQLLAWGHP